MANANRTQIKTRFGQIMEAVTGIALARAGFSFHSDWEYETSSMKVDFAIPENDQPDYIIEVTQTETRDSLKRKLLRYFELVAESKVNFQESLSTITLIYGTPIRDLPEPNLKASLVFFDAAFLPRVDSLISDPDKDFLRELEEQALSLASQLVKRDEAVAQLETECSEGIDILSRYFKQRIPRIQANPILTQMWNLEKERVSKIQISQELKPIETYYKRGILYALFLTETEYNELLKHCHDSETGGINLHPDFLQLPQKLLDRLVVLGLAHIIPGTASDEIHLVKELRSVLESPKSLRMVDLARKALQENEITKWFFEDIYQDSRRKTMATHFLDLLKRQPDELSNAIYSNLKFDDYAGIKHVRTWMVEMILRVTGISSNSLTKIIFLDQANTLKLGDPLSHLIPKTKRFMNKPDAWQRYADAIVHHTQSDLLTKISEIDVSTLAGAVLKSRLDGAMYLQKFNPLYLVVEVALQAANWENISYKSINSIFGNLLNKKSVGRFSVFSATKNQQQLVLNALQISDAHKPDEWAARGRALRYGLQQNPDGTQKVIRQMEDTHFVFILDGKLNLKMRKRLENSGWQTCTLDEFPDVLNQISETA